jgi:hypothetical protein
MNSYLDHIKKYRTKGILLDTNILLLYIVGTLYDGRPQDFKRTSKFSEEDFEILLKLLNSFDIKVTTPNILTEVSNLIGNRIELHEPLAGYIKITQESFIKSTSLVEEDFFAEFGLADTATVNMAKDSFLVVTDDGPLYGLLINNRVDAINFDQLRTELS